MNVCVCVCIYIYIERERERETEREKRFNDKNKAYKIVAWIVRTLLKFQAIKSLTTQLLKCKVSSHTGDWMDRWRLNMGH